MTYNQSTLRQIANITQGIRVDTDAVLTSPNNRKVLFNVEGGECVITGLVGVVTTVIGGVACAVTYDSTPDAGTAVNLSAGVGDINALEEGGHVSLTGTFADNTLIANAGAGQLFLRPFIVAPGTIGITMAGDTVTGAIRYSIWYIPAERGAYIEPA